MRDKGLAIASASTVAAALPRLYERQPEIAVLCLTGTRSQLPGQIAHVRQAAPRIRVVAVVQLEVDVEAAMRAGADDALSLEHSGDRLCLPLLEWATGAGRPISGARLLGRRNAYLEARIAELERENAHLAELAAIDEASGLVARTGFVQQLARGSAGSLLVIDLPGLGQQIDVLGGFVIGGLLQQIAATLVGCARATDIVARIGPERFAIWMPEVAEPAALAVVESVRRVLGKLELPRCGRVRATLELCRLGAPGIAAADLLAACEARLPDSGDAATPHAA